jgi:hypothetical protein
VGPVLALAEGANAWRKITNPRIESSIDSLAEAIKIILSAVGIGPSTAGSTCEISDQLQSEKKMGIKNQQFDWLAIQIKGDECLKEKYVNVKEMKCVNGGSLNQISLLSKSPERNEYQSIVELNQNKIQSVILNKIKDEGTSISIAAENNSSFLVCIKAPILTQVIDEKRWIKKSTCASMKSVNDVSVLKRLDKIILSQLSIDFFSELQRVINTLSDYSSSVIQCCNQTACLSNISNLPSNKKIFDISTL